MDKEEIKKLEIIAKTKGRFRNLVYEWVSDPASYLNNEKECDDVIDAVIDKLVKTLTKPQKDFLTWYTTGNNKHYSGDKLIEKYKKEVLNQ